MTTKKGEELVTRSKAVPVEVQPETSVAGRGIALIERMATDPNCDPAKLRELLAIQRDWEKEEARKAYFAALADLQGVMPTIVKTRKVLNKHGALIYKFASLDQEIQIMRPLEKQYGFTHRFDFAQSDEGGLSVTCHITHVAGHTEPTTVYVPPTKGINTNSAQDRRIMETYGKRGSYEGGFGIATGCEDADGQGADSKPVEIVTAEQAATLKRLCKKTQCLMSMLAWAKVERVEDFPAKLYAEAVQNLKKKNAPKPKPEPEAEVPAGGWLARAEVLEEGAPQMTIHLARKSVGIRDDEALDTLGEAKLVDYASTLKARLR